MKITTTSSPNSFLNYSMEEDEIILDLIYVDISDRNKGIGTLLINLLKSIAIENKLPITLYAEPFNDASISSEDLLKFYYKCGFEDDRELGDKFLKYKL